VEASEAAAAKDVDVAKAAVVVAEVNSEVAVAEIVDVVGAVDVAMEDSHQEVKVVALLVDLLVAVRLASTLTTRVLFQAWGHRLSIKVS